MQSLLVFRLTSWIKNISCQSLPFNNDEYVEKKKKSNLNLCGQKIEVHTLEARFAATFP